MKIVGINSSPKGEKSQTLKLVNAVLDAAKAKGVETELLDLYKFNIQYCIGCFTCHRTGVCIHTDDCAQILNKIMESDGLVLGSPVFYSHVGAKIKTLIDRMGDPTHCLFLKNKYGCSVSTSGMFGHEEAIEYLNYFMQFSGGLTLDGIGVPVSAGPETMEEALQWAAELGEDLVNAIRSKEQYPEQDSLHQQTAESFKFQIQMNKDWTHTYEYWLTKGWLD